MVICRPTAEVAGEGRAVHARRQLRQVWRGGAGLPVGVLLAALVWALAGSVDGGPLDAPLVFCQQPPEADGVDGSRIVRLEPDGSLRVLTAGFAAAADPAVAPDGQRVLFAGRLRSSDPWDIWIMDADGSRQRQLTRDLGDCREPVFLPRAAVDPPEFLHIVRWVGFVSTAPGVVDERGMAPLQSLYAINLDPLPGEQQVLWRTTFGLGGDLSPTVLDDGRVLYASWQRSGYALMAVTWAGEGVNAFYGTHDGDWSQLSPCEVTARREVVFVERQGGTADRSGRLASVSLRRPLRSHTVLSRDTGRYRTPHAQPDGRLLVSHAAGERTFGLYEFDRDRGRPGRVVFDAPDWDDVDPQLLVARREPMSRIPMVETASVLDVGGYERAGQLQCLDVYDTDRPEVAAVPRGAVKAVRLVEGLAYTADELAHASPAAVAADSSAWPPRWVRTSPLGTAPVEPDGSFYVNVAGNVPFYMETLDEDGQVLSTMRAWVWVRNRDQRGCVGCHEDKELAPVNRATQALIKAAPLDLMGPRQAKAGHP